MSQKTTVLLSIIFVILLGLLVSLWIGWIRSPFAPESKTDGPPVVTQVNTNAVKIRIKRPANTNYETAFQAGMTAFNQGQFQEALQNFAEATKFEPSRLEPYQQIGESWFFLGNVEKAQENFEYILQKQQADPAAALFLARTYISQSDFDHSLELLLSLSGDNQEARYYIGLIRLIQGDADKGLNNLKTAVELGPQSSIAQKAQNVLANVDEFNLFLDGKSVHLQTLIGRSLVQNGEYTLAIEELKNALKENKQYRDAWVLLGFAYYNIQKYDLAAETLMNAYDLDPEKAETQYFLGLTYLKLGNNDKALTYLILAEKNGFQPRLEAQKKIADLYLTSQKFDEALATYLEIIQSNQANDINLYVRPIWIYLEIKKEPIEALDLAKQAREKYPNDAMGWNLLGWAYLANDDLELAQKNLEEAIRRDPNLQAVYLNLGDLYVRKNDTAKAKDLYERAYNIDRNSSIGSLAATKYNTLTEQE